MPDIVLHQDQSLRFPPCPGICLGAGIGGGDGIGSSEIVNLAISSSGLDNISTAYALAS